MSDSILYHEGNRKLQVQFDSRRISDRLGKPGCELPEPAWKGFDSFKDAVHPRQPTYKG
jgi:hypothetical protein